MTQDIDNTDRCETCLGMGYKGRYCRRRGGRAWRVETCPKCRGTGTVPAGTVQRPRRSTP